MRVENLQRVEPFITLDGSEIREVAGPPTGNAVNQSLAEATVPPGGETIEHFHRDQRGDLLLHARQRAACASATRSATSARATPS